MNKKCGVLAVFTVTLLVVTSFGAVVYGDNDEGKPDRMGVSSGRGNMLYVGGSGPGNYTTIQSAINNTSNGDTVFVYNGTYYENIVVNRSICLMGENKNTTIIDGLGYDDDVVYVSSDGVNISGFTIQNSSTFQYIAAGITLCSNGNTIMGNIIRYNDLLTYGIKLICSSNNTIIENNITSNDDYGIGTDSCSNNNIILGNTITNNRRGIQLGSDNNTVMLNTFKNNEYWGLSLSDFISNNSITGNTFFHDGLFVGSGYFQNTVTGNTVNGKPLIYIEQQSNTIISNYSEAGQIILVNCTNITIKNQELSNTSVGIQLVYTDNCLITENIITNNRDGIYLNWHDSNNTVLGNTITNNEYGILSTNNNIVGNTITNNSRGISLGSGNTIMDNTITYNQYGLEGVISNRNNSIVGNIIKNNNYGGIHFFWDCEDNLIIGNIISNNTGDGIGIYHFSSNNNKIYFNNFISNYCNAASHDAMNIWNSTSPLTYEYNGYTYTNHLGNYWDNYTGGDSDGDGIGDSPYSINADNNDYYPLIEPHENYAIKDPNRPPVADFIYTQNLVVNQTITFNASLSFDPDGEVVDYLWDFDGDGTFERGSQEVSRIFDVPGSFPINLKVKDNQGTCGVPMEKIINVIEPFSFAQITDTHLCLEDDPSDYLTYAINMINADPEVEFILVTGDIADYAVIHKEFPIEWYADAGFYKLFLDIIESSVKDVYMIPGNHDRMEFGYGHCDLDLNQYNQDIPPQNPKNRLKYLISSDYKNDYYFDYKGYRFIGLDSGYEEPLGLQGSGLTDEQWTALQKQISWINKIIFMHHPTFDDKWHILNPRTIQNHRSDFINYCKDKKNNVQLILAGHTHRNRVVNEDGKEVGDISLQRPLFIETPSAGIEDSMGMRSYRIIDVTSVGAIPRACSVISSHFIGPPHSWEGIGHCPVNLHVYDSLGRHTGMNISSGDIDRDIPQSFYISQYEIPPNETLNITDEFDIPETIILYNMSENYWFEIVANLTEEQRLSPGNNSFNFTLEKQTDTLHLTIAYNNISLLENTTAIVATNDTGNFTMFIDYDGDNITDEERLPDSIETDYSPTATILSPLNNSLYFYGENVTFNGTGIDTEDGILTNSSLKWISSLDGFLCNGTRFTTSNLMVGTHIIGLRVNDSSGQAHMVNITLTVVSPDLVIDPSNITFSDCLPIEGDIITINATVSNSGTLNATNVTVQFFVNDTITTTQIGSNYTLTHLNMSENKTISMVWDTAGYAGDNTIWVFIPSCGPAPDPIIDNNLAPRDIYVSSPTLLHITQVQTHKTRYVEGETVILSCVVQNATGNISATVTASIQKPEGTSENITLGEQTLGQYQGTFTSTLQSGSYNVTFSATRTGFTGDTELLVFQILDTQPPSPISNLTASFGSDWINWTWDNPTDPDFQYAHVYLNGERKTATTQGYYLVEGVNTSAQNCIGVLTVDTTGNVNDNWVNMTLPPAIDDFVITYQGKDEMPNQEISTNFTLSCYMAGFNATYGFVEFVHVNWSLVNSGCNASIDSSSGLSTNVFSGWYNGTAVLTADDGNGHSDTVEFIIDSSLFSTVFFKGWNLVTVPFDNSWTADTLGENISGCTVVCRFDADSQSYVTHVVGIPYNDFPVVDGSGYFVYCTQDSILSIPDLSILTVNVSIFENWNIVGWYHEYSTTAESLGDNISGCTVVCKFNSDSQSYTTHVVNIPYNDFTIERGMALFIYATDASYWYGEG